VGALFSLNVSAYASGNPAPTFSLVSSTANAGDYSFAGSTLSFTPGAAGEFAFVFQAQNELGTAMATATVTAASAPVYIPVASITDIASTSFTVNWTPCTGGSSYQLQVASDNAFSSGGGGGAILTEDFLTLTDGAPPSGWTSSLSSDLDYTSATYCGAASPAYKFRLTGQVLTSPVFATGGTNLSFFAYGNGGSGSTIAVSGLVSGVWTLIDTKTIAISGATYQVTLNPQTTQLSFHFTKSVNCGFDDVVVSGSGSGGTILLDETVSALTCPVTGLEPETLYYVRVRMAGGEWSDVISATTLSAGPVAPSFTAIPPQSASVGALFSLDVSAYASGNPAPTFSLVSSTADAGDYSFAGSTLSFTPGAAGDFGFVFMASNELGTAMATATVTAVSGPIELLAPVIQAASAIDATQFNANWLASAGATGYILDVATDETFSTGGGGEATTHISENIQSWTAHTGYGAWTQSIPAGTVNMTQCIVAPAAAASGVGSVGRVQLQATAGILALPALNTVGTVTMNIAAGGASRSVKLQKYNGSTWDDLTTWSEIGLNGAAFTFDVNDSGANVQLRIASPSSAIYVHDITVTSSGGGGGESSFVPGYENLDVGNVLTHTVTGLTEGVTYYYRVKAYNASSNSPCSAVTSVVTQASSGGEQPEIVGFQAPPGASASATLTTTTAGKTYRLQYTTNLMAEPVVWADAAEQAGTGGEITLIDVNPADIMRYYRVVEQ
jgi:hypothetical protein